MKLGKIESAILHKQSFKGYVEYYPGLNVVSVVGKKACQIARNMQKEGLIAKYESFSEYGEIGRKRDGSVRKGMTFRGRIHFHP